MTSESRPKRKGNPAWAKDPQTGRGVSGNPGGQPAWVNQVRNALRDVASEGAELCGRVVRGEKIKLVIDGTEVEVTPDLKDRLRAAEIAFAYTLPKPDAETIASAMRDSNPLAALSDDEVVGVVRKWLGR